MKTKILFTITIVILAGIASGQNTALEFLGMVPKLSVNPCSATMEQKEEFLRSLNNVDSVLKSQIENNSAKSEEFQTEHEDEARVNVLVKMGYTKEQAEKLKDADNMSEAELMAIANEMMVNKNNTSLEEYSKVAEYDTAAQGRWAQAQSTIYAAEVQTDPEKYRNEQVGIKSDFDLQTELQYQRDKIKAGEGKFIQQFDSLDASAGRARIANDLKIEKLEKELENCQNDQQREAIQGHIDQLRLDFCNEFTPRYLQIVDNYKAYIIKNLDEYDKLEDLQIRSVESQTGVKDTEYKKGTYAKGIVGSYIGKLSDAFKFAPVIRVVFD